ncbi:MAG: FtsX-like permease family protein, partial [Acidobacteriota bacterium]
HDLIVVAEIALAVTLLTGTSLLAQSFLYMKNLDPGFDPDQVLTFELQLPGNDYDGDEAVRAFYDRLVEEAEGLPGVISATAIDPLPLNFEAYSQDFYVPGGGSGQKDSERDQATEHSVGANFFATMDIDLQEGRDFALGDTADAQPVIVVNRTLADRYWPESGAVGQQLRLFPEETEAMIIGVVEDSKSLLMNEKAKPIIYTTQSQDPRARNFLALRTAADPTAMVSAAREVVRRLDPNLPLSRVRPFSSVVDTSLSPFEGSAKVLGVLTVVAFVLSGLGLWGVVAYTVGQSTQEIGLRQALGAQRKDLLKLVLRHGLFLTGTGLAIGLAISAAATYFLSSLLFGVSRLDPTTFIGIVFLMAFLTLAATFFPARKATKIPPAVALRDA